MRPYVPKLERLEMDGPINRPEKRSVGVRGYTVVRESVSLRLAGCQVCVNWRDLLRAHLVYPFTQTKRRLLDIVDWLRNGLNCEQIVPKVVEPCLYPSPKSLVVHRFVPLTRELTYIHTSDVQPEIHPPVHQPFQTRTEAIREVAKFGVRWYNQR